MGMFILGGLAVLAVLYGAFRKLDKSEGPRWLFNGVLFVLTPFIVVMFVAGALLTIVMLLVGTVMGTIWEYSKSRFA